VSKINLKNLKTRSLDSEDFLTLLSFFQLGVMDVQTVFQFGGGREFVNEERAKVQFKNREIVG
jgi:hypothetical protein